MRSYESFESVQLNIVEYVPQPPQPLQPPVCVPPSVHSKKCSVWIVVMLIVISVVLLSMCVCLIYFHFAAKSSGENKDTKIVVHATTKAPAITTTTKAPAISTTTTTMRPETTTIAWIWVGPPNTMKVHDSNFETQVGIVIFFVKSCVNSREEFQFKIIHSIGMVLTRSQAKALREILTIEQYNNMFRSLNFRFNRGERRAAREALVHFIPPIAENTSDSEADPDYHPDDDIDYPIDPPLVRPIVQSVVPAIPSIVPAIEPSVQPRRRISMNGTVQLFQMLFYVFAIVLIIVVLIHLWFSGNDEIVIRRRWWW